MTLAFLDQDLTPLLKALSPLGKAALCNLEVRADQLVLEAADEDRIRLTWSAPLASMVGAEEGTVTTHVGELRRLNAGDPSRVSLRLHKSRLVFTAGSLTGHLPTLVDRVELYLDEVSLLSAEQAFDAGQLHAAVAAMAGYRNDKLEGVLPGLYRMFIGKDEVCATDGHSMSFARLFYSGQQQQLPWELTTLPLDPEGSVGLTWGPAALRVDQGQAQWWLRLLQLPTIDLPDTGREHLIPDAEQGPQSWRMDTAPLVAAVKQLCSLASPVALRLIVDDQDLVVETPVDGDRSGSLRLPIRDVDGEPQLVGEVGTTVLLNALACHKGEILVRRPKSGSAKPWLFRSEEATSILMPRRQDNGAI